MSQLKVDGGTRLNYEQDGDGPLSVLFLHGFAASIRNWDDIRPDLFCPARRLVFVDLPGHGFSSYKAQGRCSPVDHANSIVSFMDQLGLKNTTLVGHSYGGAIALLSALRLQEKSPELLRSLVLIDSAGYGTGLPLFMDFLRTPIIGKVGVHLIPEAMQVRISLLRAFHDRRKITSQLVNRYTFFYRRPGVKRVFRKMAEAAIPENQGYYEARFQEIENRTLILWGENDQLIPLSRGKRFARDLPHAELEVIKECGHIPQEERPKETASRLNSFLRDIERRDA